MPKFAANLSFLFQDLPFSDRFSAAAGAGFRGVEFLFPYAWPAADVKDWLAAANLEQALFNAPPGDWEEGDRGIAALPGRESEFRDGFGRALDYARALECPRVHVMAGIPAESVPARRAHETYVANLAWAAAQAAQTGVTVTIEPINPVDMPGYLLATCDQAAVVLDAVDHPNLGLQLDLYHAEVVTGDAGAVLERYLPRAVHVQFAGQPGRHEPDRGSLPYAALLDRLDAAGYGGWVGCEYRPEADTLAGLTRWGAAYGLGG